MESTARKIDIPVISIATGGLTDRQIDIRAKRFAELDAAIKALEKERDAVKAELISGIDGVRETAHYKVSNQVITSSRFDTKAFKAEHPEQYSKYCRESTSTRFSVKAV